MEDKFFKKYEKFFNKLSVKYSVTVPQIKEIIELFFIDFKKAMCSPLLPKLKITGLGSFIPTLGRVKERFRMKFYWYRKGVISKENIKEFIRTHWPVYNRLKQEKEKMITWDFWRNVDSDTYPESYYKLKESNEERK